MPKLPQYNSTKLFHKLAREAKNEWIAREGRKPTRDEWNQIQKWTSKNLYQEFKGRSYRRVPLREIKEEIFVRSAPKEKIKCGDVFQVNPQQYQLVDWWDVYNSTAGLPPDVQVRVNAGEFGISKIDQVRFFSYEEDVSPIVDLIREFTSNKSADTFFEGVIKVRPDRKDDGKPCSYFIDYVLVIGGEMVDSTEGVEIPPDVEMEDDRERRKRQKEAERKSRQRKIEKAKKAKKRKRPKSVVKPPAKKKKKKKKPPVETRDRVAEIREVRKLFEEGLIDKKTLQQAILNITSKKDGGIV